MKKILIFTAMLVFGLSSISFGWGDDDAKYESSFGNKYEYDLSRPGDRLRYEVDPSAQMRDELYKPITPSVELEEGLGQYGGGIKR